MATCKNCIHQRVCYALIESGLPYLDNGKLPAEAFCMAFKNKLDFVEVVRCKDCKYWKPSDARGGDSVNDMQTLGGCEYVRYCRREKDFCSYGERKEE